MHHISSLDEATSFLLNYAPHRVQHENYTLERIKGLMEYLGDPQNKLKVIHVAGTSGKTSTAYFIRGMLEKADLKTGLTVSPHIVALNERAQVGGKPLAPKIFLNYLSEYLTLVDKTHVRFTYFELLIAFAYWVFEKEKVDIAVIETGVGGLLDGSNTVSRADKVSVITSIGYDHMEILGKTLPEIAYQKAGIIVPGSDVITYHQAPEIMEVFAEQTKRQQTQLHIANSEGPFPEGLATFQRANWCLARMAYEFVRERDGLMELSAQDFEAVSHQTPPGRYEVYHRSGKTVILDGAHNPQKLQGFVGSLHGNGIHAATCLVSLSEAPDHKIANSLKVLAPLAQSMVLTQFALGQNTKFRRSVELDKLSTMAHEAGCRSVSGIADPVRAVKVLLENNDPVIVITGSLYLIATVRPYIQAHFDSKSIS